MKRLDEPLELEELDRNRTVHLVGIGGAGMSAIATVLLEMGYQVEGSDIKESRNVKRLREMGAVVGIGHRQHNVGAAQLIVKSAAIPGDNPELAEARERGIPVIGRAQMLAAIMATRKGIAVSGTHGKTTTSSMATQMLLCCDADPSFLIGGELNEIGGNAHYADGRYLVAEADESDGSLLYLRPDVVILTNVDGDHMDYFEDLEHARGVFLDFLRLLPPGGLAIVCGDDPAAREVGWKYSKEGGNVVFYGMAEGNRYRFEEERIGRSGNTYRAFRNEELLGTVRTTVPGRHNTYNSLAVLALGEELGFGKERILDGIRGFSGVRRRFEEVGSAAGIDVLDDYAHHPTEIQAVLQLAREVAHQRVVVVFQPHRYSRTKLLAEEFGRCFEGADMVVLADVYGAGEDPEPGITGRLILDSIRKQSPAIEVIYEPDRSALADRVVSVISKGDMLITMGAGDVTQCAREILDLLRREDGQLE